MIIYIASYPRSGNSLIKELFDYAFQIPVTNIYPLGNMEHPPEYQFTCNCRMSSLLSPKEKKEGLVWDDNIAVFNRNGFIKEINYRFLCRGSLKYLNEEKRKRFAAEKNVFVIKTHEKPYKIYFKGEYIIQPVRKPGPTIRSYHKLIHSKGGINILRTKLSVILGITRFRSYKVYYNAWNKMYSNTDRMIRLDFNEVRNNKNKACKIISILTGLPSDKEAVFPDFSQKRKLDSRMFVFGSDDKWEKYFNFSELFLIRKMEKYYRI